MDEEAVGEANEAKVEHVEDSDQNMFASENHTVDESVEVSSQEQSSESSIEPEKAQVALQVDQIQSSSDQPTDSKVLKVARTEVPLGKFFYILFTMFFGTI